MSNFKMKQKESTVCFRDISSVKKLSKLLKKKIKFIKIRVKIVQGAIASIAPLKIASTIVNSFILLFTT